MNLPALLEAGLTAAGTRLLTADELRQFSHYAISHNSLIQTIESYELRGGLEIAAWDEFNYWPDDVDLSVENVSAAIESVIARCAETNAEFGFQVWIRKF